MSPLSPLSLASTVPGSVAVVPSFQSNPSQVPRSSAYLDTVRFGDTPEAASADGKEKGWFDRFIDDIKNFFDNAIGHVKKVFSTPIFIINHLPYFKDAVWSMPSIYASLAKADEKASGIKVLRNALLLTTSRLYDTMLIKEAETDDQGLLTVAAQKEVLKKQQESVLPNLKTVLKEFPGLLKTPEEPVVFKTFKDTGEADDVDTLLEKLFELHPKLIKDGQAQGFLTTHLKKMDSEAQQKIQKASLEALQPIANDLADGKLKEAKEKIEALPT